jgi:glycosyltransferase involved in cell wall biosynthesis
MSFNATLPKRVAFHLPNLNAGGAEKMRLVLARELIKLGIAVDLVLCEAKGEYLPQVPETVRVINLKSKRTLSSIIPLLKYMLSERPDVLISSLGAQNIAAISANLLGVKPTTVAVTQHNSLSKEANLTRTRQQRYMPFLYRYFLPLADGVIAVSEGVADDMSIVAQFDRSRINVLYNPAYPDGLADKLADPYFHPLFEANEPVILAVGRLIEQKGFDTLIEAFALLAKEKSVQLAILGVGHLLGQLQQQAERLGISQRVHFLGFQQNPLVFMKNSKMLVLSSRYEGFGNVLVESMACGTPVVSTDCESGPSEILEKGKYGELVMVDDIPALYRAMLKTLATPISSDVLRCRAMEFHPGQIVQQYLNVINKILKY